MTRAAAQAPSSLAPFGVQGFRLLWITWLIANLCMWMGDVSAAWLMTTLTSEPVWVALVQSAATLPIFLFGLPSGALADILDRKRFLLVSQTLVAVLFAATAGAVFMGLLSPGLLLALTLAGGIGMAMRWPVFVAMVSESVPRPMLPTALALNGLPMNASRIFGPLLAGALIVWAGIAWVFLLNAVLSALAVLVVARWPRPDGLRQDRSDGLLAAMRGGWQFVWHSPSIKGILLRIAIFFWHSTALLALLPLVAKRLEDGGAYVYTFLLACMGVGAMLGIFGLRRLRQALSRDALLMMGSGLQSMAMLVLAMTSHLPLAGLAMFFAGFAWTSCVNNLTVSAQMSLPDWVRARGMSMVQMSVMGSTALAAAWWGKIATWFDVPVALWVSALCAVPAMWIVNRWGPAQDLLDPTPVRQAEAVAASPASVPDQPVTVVRTYQVSLDQQGNFLEAMRRKRSSEFRRGARRWVLRQDACDPTIYREVIEDVSWSACQRRTAAMSESDLALSTVLRPFEAEKDRETVAFLVKL